MRATKLRPTVVRPELLLDVATGELLTDRAVVVEADRIVDVRAAADAPHEGPAAVGLPGYTLLPGLIDCHTHLVASQTVDMAMPIC